MLRSARKSLRRRPSKPNWIDSTCNILSFPVEDVSQYTIRQQIANVEGAAVPPPFGGRYRQIMVYVDPLKLGAYHLSVMDVVRIIARLRGPARQSPTTVTRMLR